MSLDYVCERSHRSINMLCIHPSALRVRLADAWDEGMSQIAPSEIPEGWDSARLLLSTLRAEFNRREDSRSGNARASLRRRHDTTLVALAKKMVSLDAWFQTMFEAHGQQMTGEKQGHSRRTDSA
ncbi:hypothetical protein [Frigidibacter oleivorans]|uniref:hypothetical protein n=1 Tax=Frigidibacter oleivorans TaxID=2487129 RepID=UPI000F8CC1CD|nr:hypothetical protein [Frigidibacter oleivorans]